MKTQMNDLVSMRDTQSLYEIMTEDDDWMNQLDAAEGLIELDDRRGLEFIISAVDSDVTDMGETAQEILDSPKAVAMLAEIEAERKRRHDKRLQAGKSRLAEGKKVFRYKVVYLMPDGLSQSTIFDGGFDLPDLNELGADGWEVVNALPGFLNEAKSRSGGTYFLLKKELTSKDQAELDEV